MIITHKIRLNPTTDQETYFRKACGITRFVYNWGLSEWKRHKDESSDPYGIMAIKKDFNSIKRKEFPWITEICKDVPENAFFRLSSALSNYFNDKNSKKIKKFGFPNFKSKKSPKQSFGINNDKIKIKDHFIRIPKLGWVNMTENLRFNGKILKVTILKKINHWFVLFVIDIKNKSVQSADIKKSIGIDLGIKTLVVLSDGTKFENQGFIKHYLNKIRKYNRILSRRKLGSNRYYNAKMKLAVLHNKIACKREDYLHKMTSWIVANYDFIGMEDLNINTMLKNHLFSKSISDASFGNIRRMIEYKCDLHGKRFQVVDAFYPSSKTCSCCGNIKQDLVLSDRIYYCYNCGIEIDRDLNAAKNIEKEAICIAFPGSVAPSGYARGQDIRPLEAVLDEARISNENIFSQER